MSLSERLNARRGTDYSEAGIAAEVFDAVLRRVDASGPASVRNDERFRTNLLRLLADGAAIDVLLLEADDTSRQLLELVDEIADSPAEKSDLALSIGEVATWTARELSLMAMAGAERGRALALREKMGREQLMQHIEHQQQLIANLRELV